jgi:hypothetical protein
MPPYPPPARVEVATLLNVAPIEADTAAGVANVITGVGATLPIVVKEPAAVAPVPAALFAATVSVYAVPLAKSLKAKGDVLARFDTAVPPNVGMALIV